MTLELQQGPDCPRCGCNHTRAMGSFGWWGKGRAGTVKHERRQCTHCGNRFSAPAEDLPDVPPQAPMIAAVPGWPRTRCPRCGGKRVPVTSTRANELPGCIVRHHRCESCDERFKSVERESG